MPERAWYQSGWTVLGIVVFAVWLIPLLYQGWRRSQDGAREPADRRMYQPTDVRRAEL